MDNFQPDEIMIPVFSKYTPEEMSRAREDFVADQFVQLSRQERDIRTFRESLTNKEINNKKWVTYRELKEICQDASDTVQQLVGRAEFYARMMEELDAYGRLSMEVVLKYLNRHLTVFRYRILLTKYDTTLCGWLSKEEFMTFYEDEVMQTHPVLKEMDENLKVYYLITVELKFFFYLDSKSLKRIRICDIIASGYLDEVFNLEVDDGISWLSPARTRDLLFEFDGLDSTRQGILEYEDLLNYHDGSLTPTFVKRLFLVLHSEGKPSGLAFDDYTEFVLAYNHPKDRASIRYFFRMLDVDGDGYLSKADIKYFYPDLAVFFQAAVKEEGAMPSFDDVYDQLYDMVGPKDPLRITIQDLIDSNQGHIFVLTLIDHVEFHKYEFRESQGVADDDQDSVFPSDEAAETEVEQNLSVTSV